MPHVCSSYSKHANTGCNEHFTTGLSNVFLLIPRQTLCCLSHCFMSSILRLNLFLEMWCMCLKTLASSHFWLYMTKSLIVMHVCSHAVVLQQLALVSHDPWRPTISVTQTRHSYTGQPAALSPYCFPSLHSWPCTLNCRGLFLFIMGGVFLLYCCCLPALPPFIHWPLLYFLFVRRASGHPRGSLVNPLNQGRVRLW